MSSANADAVDATTGPGTFDERAAKALTESMTVLDGSLDHDLRDEEFRVYTPTGTYTVDAIAETCDCPDALHRGARCKHQRRVDYARGAVPIPGWVDRSAVDEQLGQHLAASPRIATADGRTEVFEA
ncbi:hypothetical protein PM038_00125 [Halorubrum ezzemoulense]|uniref:hypothetical protein n=1 Tax=Halorubrum ezzemoulense TaxID=337243 RepID=UPI00232DA46A|nr:hypothetical protein [Halorubrum ezzemoulense]MDB2283681.1 hypothetical protein [Halorubrum ezzemoulense]